MKKRDILIVFLATLLILFGICFGYYMGEKPLNDDLKEKKETSEFESQISEEKTSIERHVINASVMTKYNNKEIIVYSDTTCFFNLRVSICDGDVISDNSYGEFQITGGETIILNINDLAPNFFTDNAVITYVSDVDNPYIYGDSALACDKYSSINCSLFMKYSDKEIIISSDKTCYFDLRVATKDKEFNSSDKYKKLKIS